jgi:ribonuclease P protein component
MEHHLHTESFSKKERLKGAENFTKLYQKGKRIKLPGLNIIVEKNDLMYCRIGMSVSRKIGKATKRNRAKRLIREVYRTNKTIFLSGYDLIFIPNKNFFDLDFSELKGNLAKAFEKIKKGIDN